MGVTVKVNIKTSKILEQIKENAKKGAQYVDIGVNAEEGSQQYPSKDGSPVTVAQVASFQEFGWVQQTTSKQRGFFALNWGIRLKKGSLFMPPRPFLRATALAEKDKWIKIVADTIKANGIQDLKSALVAVGLQAKTDVQETINNGGTSKEKFEKRSGLTQKIYARESMDHVTDGTGGIEGDKPLFKTGTLLNAITFKLRDK